MIDVVDSVQRLAGSWKRVATYIHVKGDAIDRIEQNNPRDAQQCLHESIVEWLRKNYNLEKFGPPSWKMLVGAVKRLDNSLALEIANAHRGMCTANCRGIVVELHWPVGVGQCTIRSAYMGSMNNRVE